MKSRSYCLEKQELLPGKAGKATWKTDYLTAWGSVVYCLEKHELIATLPKLEISGQGL